MTIDWYKVFNLTEFNALGLVSRTYTVNLEGIGLTEVLVTKGNEVSVLFDEVFLTIGINDRNPFLFEDRAVYLDGNNDVWIGVKQ